VSQDLAEQLKAIVANQLGVAQDEVIPGSRILDDLGADSLDVVELVMALEETFDIIVPDEDAEGLETVADVQAYVAARTAET
jgi:acyl carrier protein